MKQGSFTAHLFRRQAPIDGARLPRRLGFLSSYLPILRTLQGIFHLAHRLCVRYLAQQVCQ